MRRIEKNRGYTLVELLVIISLLASPTGFKDPWGKTYKFLADVDYNNTLSRLPRKKAGDPTTVITPLAIWSDGTKAAPEDPNKKLIGSWY